MKKRMSQMIMLLCDAVLAKKYGLVFIPAHLLDTVVLNAEFIPLRDEFGHQRLREGKYTTGQIDTQGTDEIKKDFGIGIEINEGNEKYTMP